MAPDAKLRMDVYQEGQRAFNAGTACPYTDWRAGTWEKGRAAAQAHSEQMPAARAEPEEPKFDRDALFRKMRELGYTTRAQTDEILDLFEDALR